MIYSTIRQYSEDIFGRYSTSISTLVSKYGENNTFLLLFTVAVIVRFFVVSIVGEFSFGDARIFLIFFMQDYLVFLVLILSIWIALACLMRTSLQQIFLPMTLAPLLVVMPPLIDLIVTGGGGYWSFYLLSDLPTLWLQYSTFFGHLPPAVIYVGTRIMVLIAVIIATLFVYYATRSLVRMLLTAIVVYSIFFIFASFPSWVALCVLWATEGVLPWMVSTPDIAGFVLTPHPIFMTHTLTLSTALSVKLNMLYVLIVLALFIGKSFLDKQLLLTKKILCNVCTLKNALYFLLYAFAPLIFALYSYSAHAPYEEIFFSSIFLTIVVLVYGSVVLYITHSSWHRKSFCTIRTTGIILLFITSCVLSYKIGFLLSVLIACVWLVRFFATAYALPMLLTTSFIGSLLFYILFSPGHTLAAYPWTLSAYVLMVLFAIKSLEMLLQHQEHALINRIFIFFLGGAALFITFFFHFYQSLFMPMGLLWFLAGVSFFVHNAKLYVYLLRLYSIIFLAQIVMHALTSA